LVALGVAGVVCVVVILVCQRWIVRGRRASERQHLVAPVALYMAVIGAMTAAACGTLHPLAAAGAILFFASDGLPAALGSPGEHRSLPVRAGADSGVHGDRA
jgi:uncharacterized membrane protein YhhN